jgi:methylglyoxal synthase
MGLALIAHDNKKVDLVAWATFNRDTLAPSDLVGTGHSARLVRERVGLDVEALLSPVTTNLATANFVIAALAPCDARQTTCSSQARSRAHLRDSPGWTAPSAEPNVPN